MTHHKRDGSAHHGFLKEGEPQAFFTEEEVIDFKPKLQRRGGAAGWQPYPCRKGRMNSYALPGKGWEHLQSAEENILQFKKMGEKGGAFVILGNSPWYS